MITALKPYPGMKDSGVPWLGKVPDHWNVLRLKYGAELINEKVDGISCELPYTGLEHIESWIGKCLATDAQTSSDGQACVHRAGDVLFGKLRPYLAKAYAAEGDGVCTSELLVLRPKALLQRFLRDYLLSQSFISVVDSSTYGAKMPRASWDFIGSLPVVVPPLDEQRAVVLFLDRETARIDALIEKKRRQIELLHEKRAALISHAVTKGLDPNAPMKDSGIEWLGAVPAHWRVLELRRVASDLQTGPFGSQLHASDYVDAGIPIVNPANIQDGVIIPDSRTSVDDDTFARLRRYALEEGDIIFGRRGEMGRCALVRESEQGFLCGTGSIRVRLRASSVHPGFLAFFLRHPGVHDHLLLESVGSTMDNLNTTIIGRIPIALPPFQEQLDIEKQIHQDQDQVDRLVVKIGVSIDRLREYRTALISAAVTGKIDVRKEVA